MRYIRYIIGFVLLGAIVFYSSCGGKGSETPELTDQQKAAKALGGAWGGPGKVSDVTAPAGLQPDNYSEINNLKLTFGADGQSNPTTFSAEGGGNIFPPFTGTWNWAGAGINTIAIVGTNPDITQLVEFSFLPSVENPTSIRFKFNSQCAACRTTDVTGDYIVTLSK